MVIAPLPPLYCPIAADVQNVRRMFFGLLRNHFLKKKTSQPVFCHAGGREAAGESRGWEGESEGERKGGRGEDKGFIFLKGGVRDGWKVWGGG